MEDFSNLFYSIEHLEETREHQIVVELRGTTRKVQKLKKRSINFREIIQEAERERKVRKCFLIHKGIHIR